MSSDTAVFIDTVSKCFHLFDSPQDRLKQSILSRVRSVAGLQPTRYGREFWALKDISFEVKQGETVGIIGRNGSGKSTLLQIICGTLSPTSGTVRTQGRIAALLELGSGFNPDFTGRENVYMNASILGLKRQEIDERFDDIAAFADIGEFIEQPVKMYSSGMFIRLAFSVAINVDPQILIVDEALSVGDELFQRKCFSRIEAMRKRGTTVMFVSHSGSTIVELCDRAVLLDAGEKLAVGLPKFVVAKYQKLLYAPNDKRLALREEIRKSGDSVPVMQPERDETSDLDAGRDFFDPSLNPQSTIPYESRGALIIAPILLNSSGERVNCLQHGGKYRYSFSVRFDQPADNVRFGMMIKTTSGFELGGVVSASHEGVFPIEKGTEIMAEFDFTCLLNPGTYFLNAGVVGNIEGTEVFLHRIVDSDVIRVLPMDSSVVTGFVDFCFTCKIDMIEGVKHGE